MELDAEQVSIIGKVQKLLALSASTTHEAEAQAASAKAMEMLAAYNIDMMHVERASNKKSSARDDRKLAGGLYKWQRDLWQAVAELNFCMYWSFKGLTKGAKYEHRVLGSTVNVLSTRLMAEYLQGAVDRMAQGWAKDRGFNVFCRDAIAYREGIAARLVERLDAKRLDEQYGAERKRDEERAKYGTANALTLLDVIDAEHDANMDHLYGEGYSARKRAERAEANARYEELQRQRREWREANPELAAEEDKKNRKWYEDYLAKQAKRKPRKERPAKAEPGPRSYTYYEGRQAGDSISLDKQVDTDNRKAIR